MTREASAGAFTARRAGIATGAVVLILAAARPFAVQPTPRLTLALQDYAALPVTADNTNDNTRAQLARINYLRDEPGGRRFFVNDLNGPLYILDTQTKTFTTYLDFNGAGGRPGLFPKFTFELIEWKDRNPSNSTFEGTARELLRLQHPLPQHPLGEMTFNPAARPGDADWRVMYLGAGDSGSGEQRDSRRLNPQRLDTLVGKILRIVPDLREHTNTSTVSENGRYRTPNDNPFSTIAGARKEIWAYGLRNPHRLIWDVDAAQPRTPTLLAFNIGLVTWETVVVIHKGANYGYPLREGTQSMSSTNGMGPLPEDDIIPIQVSDTVTRGTVTPTYPVIKYPHTREAGGDAIANGFVYRGKLIPALRDKLVFGDITTGRIWYANRADVLAADDVNPTSVAPIHEVDADLRRIAEENYRERGGKGQALPGMSMIAGWGRVDLRFAVDNDGELYILTKSDGMIRNVVGAKAAAAPAPTVTAPTPSAGQNVTSQPVASLGNPVASTLESIAAGKRAYDATCAPVTGIWLRERSKPASRFPSSRSSEGSSRRISPTINRTMARPTATFSSSSSVACRRP